MMLRVNSLEAQLFEENEELLRNILRSWRIWQSQKSPKKRGKLAAHGRTVYKELHPSEMPNLLTKTMDMVAQVQRRRRKRFNHILKVGKNASIESSDPSQQEIATPETVLFPVIENKSPRQSNFTRASPRRTASPRTDISKLFSSSDPTPKHDELRPAVSTLRKAVTGTPDIPFIPNPPSSGLRRESFQRRAQAIQASPRASPRTSRIQEQRDLVVPKASTAGNLHSPTLYPTQSSPSPRPKTASVEITEHASLLHSKTCSTSPDDFSSVYISDRDTPTEFSSPEHDRFCTPRSDVHSSIRSDRYVSYRSSTRSDLSKNSQGNHIKIGTTSRVKIGSHLKKDSSESSRCSDSLHFIPGHGSHFEKNQDLAEFVKLLVDPVMNSPGTEVTKQAPAFSSVAAIFNFQHHVGSNPALELTVLKEILIREDFIARIQESVQEMSQEKSDVLSNESADMLKLLISNLRESSVEVIEAVLTWRNDFCNTSRPVTSKKMLAPSIPPAFFYHGQNYLLKMISDMDFLAKVGALPELVQIPSGNMKRNPLLMPLTLDEVYELEEFDEENEEPEQKLIDACYVLIEEEMLEQERLAEQSAPRNWSAKEPPPSASFSVRPESSDWTFLAENEGRSLTPNIQQRGSVFTAANIEKYRNIRTWYKEACHQLYELQNSGEPGFCTNYGSRKRLQEASRIEDPSMAPPSKNYPEEEGEDSRSGGIPLKNASTPTNISGSPHVPNMGPANTTMSALRAYRIKRRPKAASSQHTPSLYEQVPKNRLLHLSGLSWVRFPGAGESDPDTPETCSSKSGRSTGTKMMEEYLAFKNKQQKSNDKDLKSKDCAQPISDGEQILYTCPNDSDCLQNTEQPPSDTSRAKDLAGFRKKKSWGHNSLGMVDERMPVITHQNELNMQQCC